jgi:O-methyltransferase
VSNVTPEPDTLPTFADPYADRPRPDRPEGLYLDLMKLCLTRYIFGDASVGPRSDKPLKPSTRANGRDWPTEAETMIGLRRLDNLEECIIDVLRQGVAGDLIETGVWRGGATIFMRAVLNAYGDRTRTVWAADSFEGLPKPDPDAYPADEGDRHWQKAELAVSLDEVKANFRRYGLLDEQVRFLVGWFRDTLPSAPIERLAVLRLDGDMYESTMVA